MKMVWLSLPSDKLKQPLRAKISDGSIDWLDNKILSKFSRLKIKMDHYAISTRFQTWLIAKTNKRFRFETILIGPN
jgi:hypothetical protein